MSIPRHEVAACTVCVEEGRASGREKGRMGAQLTWLGWYIEGAQRRTRIHSMNVWGNFTTLKKHPLHFPDQWYQRSGEEAPTKITGNNSVDPSSCTQKKIRTYHSEGLKRGVWILRPHSLLAPSSILLSHSLCTVAVSFPLHLPYLSSHNPRWSWWLFLLSQVVNS